MGRIGFTEILLILIVALLLFGTAKLPEIGKALGRAIYEFKRSLAGDHSHDEKPSDKK